MGHDHRKTAVYTCPMHPEVKQDKPGVCPKCGMRLIEKTENGKQSTEDMDHDSMKHTEHVMKSISQMPFWEKLKMSMTMTMGMDHTGLAGREMAQLMEEDIRNKFFVSFLLTIPIVLYAMGEMLFGLVLPTPIPKPWLLFLLTTPVFFYGGWLFLFFSYFEIKNRTFGVAFLIAVGISGAYLFCFV